MEAVQVANVEPPLGDELDLATADHVDVGASNVDGPAMFQRAGHIGSPNAASRQSLRGVLGESWTGRTVVAKLHVSLLCPVGDTKNATSVPALTKLWTPDLWHS